MSNKTAIAFVSLSVLLVLFVGVGKTEDQTHILGFKLARQILTAVLDERGVTKRRGYDLEYYDGKDPRFYFFAASWDTPKSSIAWGVGHYAVNRVTGEVWETSGCDQITSSRADKMRAEILRSTKPGKAEYDRAKRFSPCP